MDLGCELRDKTNNIFLSSHDPNKTVEYANKTSDDKKQFKFEVLDIETKKLPDEYSFQNLIIYSHLHWCSQMFRNIYRIRFDLVNLYLY
ncbi:hypothetical protein ACFW04_014731 [Cataglyphis niger]